MPDQLKYLVCIAIIFSACIFEIDKKPKSISPGVVFRTIRILPDVLPESSGLEISDSLVFYSMNDSKGDAELHLFDTTGALIRTIEIANAENNDWEDLTQDDMGNIYIGDFGNNDNKRTDLKIYRMMNPSVFSGNTALADTIAFSYEDQVKFPAPDSAAHFDCEAFFIFRDTFFLFTKDRAKRSEGKTVMYRIPAQAGRHVARRAGEFTTFKSKRDGAVTAADISPDGRKVALISEKRVWIFSEFQGTDFFGGKVKIIKIPVSYQMEGVVFADDCLLYLTSEKSSGDFSALHQLQICSF